MKTIITRTAQKNATDIIKYLKDNFGDRIASEFVNKIEYTLNLIEKNPSIGKDYTTVIKCLVIIKQITVYYKIEKNTIYILTYFDNRQNPNKLNKLIS